MKKENNLTKKLNTANIGDVVRHTELINGKSVEFSFVRMKNGWIALSEHNICFVPSARKEYNEIIG